MMHRIARAGLVFLLALAWTGCQTGTTPVPESRIDATEALGTATLGLEPTPWNPSVEAPARLISRHVDVAPIIDGHVDAAWDQAKLLVAPLFWGLDGAEHALDIKLWALHTDETIYFLAQWPGDPLPTVIGDTGNKLVIHWRLPESAEGLAPPSCMVACHTAFADTQGNFVYVHSETIPVGSSASLPFGGGWRGGIWTLEWSRPRVNDNPFDLHLEETNQPYRFFVKVFKWIEGRPDPISKGQFLAFEPG